MEQQKILTLPIPYFHVVFTTDHSLNPLFRQNKAVLYDLLFEVVSEVMKGEAKRVLGCEVGLAAVLHTWGQQMEEHIHLHTIVTGGGLSVDGQRWVGAKSQRYLVDVVAGARGHTFLATVGEKLPHYWKIGTHWLVTSRNYLARPFTPEVARALSRL